MLFNLWSVSDAVELVQITEDEKTHNKKAISLICKDDLLQHLFVSISRYKSSQKGQQKVTSLKIMATK